MITKDTPIIEPATGRVLSGQKEHSVGEFSEKMVLARAAQKKWAELSRGKRRAAMMRLVPALKARSEELAAIISRCTGKSLVDALATEVFPGLLGIGYYAKEGARILRPRKIPGSTILFFNKKSILTHEPYGVIGIISPWNYPFGIPFHEVLMALTAGNAVMLKVATQVQPVGDFIEELALEAGLPAGLVQTVHLPGAVAGKTFIEGGIGKLFFTGSVAVGKELMALAAPRLLPLSLELGGNDPMIVCADADITRAVYGALWAGLSNCGQSCGGVERIYIDRKIYKPFVGLLCERVKTLRQGGSGTPEVELGSLTTKSQLETVRTHVADACSRGARIIASSPEVTEKGLFHPAVILEGVSPDMRVMQEETFGPVLTVQPFDTLDEAILEANRGNLGLTASVWTTNRKTAGYLASRIEAGAISINDHLMTHGMAETPWGGYKESGLGRTHSAIGILEMAQPKVIIHDLLPKIPRNIFWHPYGKDVYRGLLGAADFLFGPRRIRGASALVKLYVSRLFKPR